MNLETITLVQLAALVSTKLTEHHVDSVLVGGGCVSIYSQNRYQSYDLDYVTYEDMNKVEIALKELHFLKKGRYFVHKKCPYFIEFVSPPVAVGDEPINNFEYHKTPIGTIKMLTPTDSVKDRLASYYHWNDEQSLDQALAICSKVPHRIDIKNLKSWSQKEKYLEKFTTFLKEFKKLSIRK